MASGYAVSTTINTDQIQAWAKIPNCSCPAMPVVDPVQNEDGSWNITFIFMGDMYNIPYTEDVDNPPSEVLGVQYSPAAQGWFESE